MKDYTEIEARQYLNAKGYTWGKFMDWMEGQTIGVDEEGNYLYYSYDVERYREYTMKEIKELVNKEYKKGETPKNIN